MLGETNLKLTKPSFQTPGHPGVDACLLKTRALLVPWLTRYEYPIVGNIHYKKVGRLDFRIEKGLRLSLEIIRQSVPVHKYVTCDNTHIDSLS